MQGQQAPPGPRRRKRKAASQGTKHCEATRPDVLYFETTGGAFVVELHRDRAPRGADRLHDLARAGFLDDSRFFGTLHPSAAACA